MSPWRIAASVAGVLVLLQISNAQACAGTDQGSAKVVYISASAVYVGAGSSSGLSVGDTIEVIHSSTERLSLVIVAISSSSSAARYSGSIGALAVGDSVTLGHHGVEAVSTTKAPEPAIKAPAPTAVPVSPSPVGQGLLAKPAHSAVRGRVAVQYAGAGIIGKRMDYSQPSVLLRLTVPDVADQPMTLNVYGRTYFDASPSFSRYGGGSRLRYRFYELSLSSQGESEVGWDVGRMTSRYVGTLGQTDGGQVTLRSGYLTMGVLLGLQPDYQTSHPDPDQQKAALFANFRFGDSYAEREEFTLAYGKQLHKGKLDRDFLSIQGMSQLGPTLFVYENSEFDLHDITNGTRRTSFHMTNAFLTVSYLPVEWLSVSSGYDAMRSIYLFDSMRSIADSLIDREIRQGFRTGVTFRLPGRMIAAFNGSFRAKTENTRAAHTLGGTFRVSEIAELPIGSGLSYSKISGSYSTGDDVTFDSDYWISPYASATVRVDQYVFHLTGLPDRFRTTTLSGSVNIRFTMGWYALVSLDQLWDTVQNSQRVFLEAGLQF
jgi:hypothetical protein